MKRLATLVLTLALLITSCKNEKEEGPYGFKKGQEYEYYSPIVFTDRDGKNPLSPPSAPVQGRLHGPPAKSKFLAATLTLIWDKHQSSFLSLLV